MALVTCDHPAARILRIDKTGALALPGVHYVLVAPVRERCRIVVLCPITAPTATWEMKREHLESVMESSRVAMASLLRQRGSKLFRHSGIHYLPLR